MLNFEVTPEQKTLVDETRRFTREKIIPIAAEADRTHEFPMDVFKEAWELGFGRAEHPRGVRWSRHGARSTTFC